MLLSDSIHFTFTNIYTPDSFSFDAKSDIIKLIQFIARTFWDYLLNVFISSEISTQVLSGKDNASSSQKKLRKQKKRIM